MLTLLMLADPAALAAGMGEALRGAILAGTCFGIATAAAAVAAHRDGGDHGWGGEP